MTQVEQLIDVNDDNVSSYSEESKLSAVCEYSTQELKAKSLRRKRSKYQNISNDLRASLIKLVIQENQKIKPTAKRLGINYSTAKSILQIYRKEGRTKKKLLFKLPGEEEEQFVHKINIRHSDLAENLSNDVKPSIRESLYLFNSRTNKQDSKGLTKPEHTLIEPDLAKKIKSEEEHLGGRSPLSFDSEPVVKKTETVPPTEALSSLKENNLKNIISAYKNDNDSAAQRFKIFPCNFFGGSAIRVPTATYAASQKHDLSSILLEQSQNRNPPDLSANMMNIDLYRYIQQQQAQLNNSRLLLLTAQNPLLNSNLLNPHLKIVPQFNPNNYPFSFQMKM